MKMFSKIGKLLLCGVAVAMIGCTDYDKDIQSVAGDVAQNATEIKNLDNAIKALEAKLAADYATKQELNAVKTALEGTIDTEVAALQAAIADAVKDLANAEDVAAVEASVKALQAAAADAAAAIEATDVKVGAIDERLTAVETAIEAIDEVAEKVLADVETLKNGYMETVAFAQQAQANIDALTEQTVDLEGQVAALEAMVDEMAGAFEERINTLGQTIGNLSNLLTDEVAALQLADEEIYVKIGEVEGTITNVLALIEDLENEDEQIYLQINSALESISAVTALIADEAAARENEDEQILLQLNKATETISAVIMTVADLETEVAEVKESLDLHVAAYEAYVAATEAKFQELLNTFASLSPVISTLQAQNAELKATLESLSPEIEAINAKIAELKNQMTSLEPVIENINAKIAELKSQMTSLEPIIKQLQAAMGELRSIVFVPEVMYDGVPAVEFKSVSYSYTVVDPKTKEETVETVYIALPAFAYYHFNPSSFDIEKGYYSLIDRAIVEKTTKAGVSNIATVMGVDYAANGTVAVELLREGLGVEVDEDVVTPNFFALEAVIAETGAIIRSDYAKVIDINEELDHDIVAADAKKPVYGTLEAAKGAEASFHLIYNKTLDLNAAVKAVSKNLDLAKYGFKVNVALVDKYVPTGMNIDQQKSVKMENGVLSTNPANSKEAIGRTPLVKFTLVDANDIVIDEAYAKVQVVVERPEDFVYTVKPAYELKWANGKKGEVNVTWEMIRENVYKVMDISQDEFYYTYVVENKAYKAEVKDAAGNAVVTIEQPVVTPNADDKSSYNISWNFSYNALPKYKGTQTFNAIVTFTNLQASSERPTHVTVVMPVAVTKAPKYEVKAEGTYETSRLAFEVKDILSTLWALYKLPNTKETLAAAAEAIQSGDLATAIKLLGGVPGIVKEKAVFTAPINPADLSKYEDNIADLVKPIVGEEFSKLVGILGASFGEKIFEYLNDEQTAALLTAMAQKEIQIKVMQANEQVMAGVAGGNWGKLLEGLDVLANLPLVEQAHVDMLKTALLGIATYPVPSNEQVTVKITKTEVEY